MRIAVTTVGSKEPPKDETQNGNRISAANQAMDIAKSKDADILALPAGFLFHDIPESRQEIAEALIDGARKRNIAVIFGVDDENEAHGYAWSPLDNATYSWDQRSSTRYWNEKPVTLNDRQWEEKIKSYDDARILTVESGIVGILLCGELFNERIKNATIKKSPKIVVDLIHKGHGWSTFSYGIVRAITSANFMSGIHSYLAMKGAII